MARTMRWLLALMCVAPLITQAADGLVQLESRHDPAATADRFVEMAEAAGLTIFARVDHADGAAGVDMDLRPTEVIIFGNPRGGTPFMQCAQSVGIDLPLKALVWQDADGRTWLGYNDPHYIAERHGVADCAAAEGIADALDRLATRTVQP